MRRVAVLSLLALSCAAAPAWAQSSVGMFGLIDTYLDRSSTGTAHATRLQSGGIQGSRLGFRGSEDLGGGNKAIFLLAPLITLAPAFAAWSVVPFDHQLVLSNANAGLLYLLAMTSLGIYGIILAGWASNSKYAFLGAMRASAQMISYEIAMGFALVGVMIASGSLNLSNIVMAQAGSSGFFDWFLIPLFPLFVVYWVSGVAETNRAPFDVVEGESQIVAGHMVEYSGGAFALFFLAEYANMILISFLISIFFLGGWLSPIQGWVNPGEISPFIDWIWKGGWPWLFVKVFFFASAYIWFRASFPRFRYDQIMRLGWKVFIPLTIFWIAVTAVMVFFGVIQKGV